MFKNVWLKSARYLSAMSSGLPDGVDPYKILGVEKTASAKEIESTFRKKSLKCHPDRNKDDAKAAAKFQLLTQAKDALLDPALRAKLDAKHKFEVEKKQRTAKQDGEKRRLREE